MSIKTLVVGVCLLAAFAGCSKIQELVIKDLKGAVAIAQANGDADGAMCYTYLLEQANKAVIKDSSPDGVFSAAALIRGVRNKDHAEFKRRCGAVAIDLALFIVETGAKRGGMFP